MIRRVIEYMVVCDGNIVTRNGANYNYEPCEDGAAYGSSTAADCAEQAEGAGWI